MSASGMRARADIHARPLSLIFVGLLVGLIGGVAIAALAGARRTDSAYSRYRAAYNEPDGLVLSCPKGIFAPEVDLAALARLPVVSSSAVMAFAPANVYDAAGRSIVYPEAQLDSTVIGLRNAAQASVLTPKLLAGRLPVGPDEIAVGWGQTGARRPSIGETIYLAMVPAGGNPFAFQSDVSKLPRLSVRVTGQVLFPDELEGDQGNLWVSPKFVAARAKQLWMCDGLIVHLKGGLQDMTSFQAGVYAIQPQANMLDINKEAIFVSRTTHLDAIELKLFSTLAALAAILVLGQSLVRRTSLGAIDTPILRALGMTRRQIVWAAALPALVVSIGGATIAVAVAGAASSVFPRGAIRIAEPSPGMRLDPYAILLGVAAIVITTLLSVVIPARWLARAHGGVGGSVEYQRVERRSKIASTIARLPLPVSAAAGARLALEPGHGHSATPVRSAVVGLTVAVAAMVASLGFAASMDHFGSTPYLFGIDFDFGAGSPFVGSLFQDKGVPLIRDDPQVRDLAAGNFQQYVSITGPRGESQEEVWALETLKGAAVTTTMLEGRWPQSPDEIGLARETLTSLGLHIGDEATARVAGTIRQMKVVGVPVFPDFGFGPGLGRGAAMTMDGLRKFYPGVTQNLAMGNFTPGADPNTVMSRLNATGLSDAGGATVVAAHANLGTTVQGTLRTRSLPLQMSILFALAAFATLVHVLITSVRRRRRDLAILQTLGFKRRQIAATVVWQALTLAGLALLFGVPIGIALGRLGWAAFALRLGVISEPIVSPLSLVVVPVTLVVAAVVSLGPGFVARRVRPAESLKAE